MKFWIVLPIFVFFAGCATSAKPIPDNIPQALLKFGPAQGIEAIGPAWYENERCEPGTYSGQVGTLSWMTGRVAEATIPADKTVFVSQYWAVGTVATAYSCGSAICTGLSQCHSMVQFTPQKGHTYAAKLEFQEKSCRTRIFDVSNGANFEVPDQQPVAACVKK